MKKNNWWQASEEEDKCTRTTNLFNFLVESNNNGLDKNQQDVRSFVQISETKRRAKLVFLHLCTRKRGRWFIISNIFLHFTDLQAGGCGRGGPRDESCSRFA